MRSLELKPYQSLIKCNRRTLFWQPCGLKSRCLSLRLHFHVCIQDIQVFISSPQGFSSHSLLPASSPCFVSVVIPTRHGNHFNCLHSFGAAHCVAQCWRWKTVETHQTSRQQFGLHAVGEGGKTSCSARNCALHWAGKRRGRSLHSSTQSSFGSFFFFSGSSVWSAAVTRSTHSSK